MPGISYANLIEKQTAINNSVEKLPFDLNVKIRRALSWIKQAEDCGSTNSDNRFLFYWIAFNALYSSRIEDSSSRSTEQIIHQKFFDKLLEADKKSRIYNVIWGPFKKRFRSLIANKYLFNNFWKFHNRDLNSERWDLSYQSRIKSFEGSLKHDEKAKALVEVFSSLYVLRNQIVHGGSTWGGDHNRNQVEICTAIISSMVPLMVDIMLESPNEDWGELHFPVLDTKDNRLGDATSDVASASDAKGEEPIVDTPEPSPDVKKIVPVSDIVEIDSEEQETEQETQQETVKGNSGFFGVLREKLRRIFRRK